MDLQPRPGVRPKKGRRDRLIALTQTRADWTLGFQDETWWSRLAQPARHAWTGDGPLRLTELARPPDDPDPAALACYGVLVQGGAPDDHPREAVWLRFVEGRPVSALTTQFLAWCCTRLAAAGATTLVLVWDNAGWHCSKEVRTWLRAHNQRAHREGGVRLVPCWLPVKSPWLNPIEPTWLHGKRKVAEPDRLLPAAELEERVHDALDCQRFDHLVMPQKVT